MKEAAAFIHIEQGTESNSLLQSHLFSSKENTLHIYMAAKGEEEKAGFCQ